MKKDPLQPNPAPNPVEIKAQRTIWIIYGVMALAILLPVIAAFIFLDGSAPE